MYSDRTNLVSSSSNDTIETLSSSCTSSTGCNLTTNAFESNKWGFNIDSNAEGAFRT